MTEAKIARITALSFALLWSLMLGWSLFRIWFPDLPVVP
jgi:hypothetical protein